MLDRFMNEKRTAFNNLRKGGLMKDEIESNFLSTLKIEEWQFWQQTGLISFSYSFYYFEKSKSLAQIYWES